MPSEPAVPVRVGRPSRSDAAQFTDHILDAATTRFLADGWRVPLDAVSAPGSIRRSSADGR
jgi:hypothetical protein